MSILNRITQVGGVWANEAPDVTQTPTSGVTYADSTLNTSDIERAWPFSIIVASNQFNEIMRRMTILLVQMEQQGVLSYSVLTDYPIGAFAMGSDGILYHALIPSGPASTVRDPVGDVSTTWEVAFRLWQKLNNNLYYIDGNVGIGTTNPTAKLEIAGQVKITGGVPGQGKVLTSDSDGLSTWTNLPPAPSTLSIIDFFSPNIDTNIRAEHKVLLLNVVSNVVLTLISYLPLVEGQLFRIKRIDSSSFSCTIAASTTGKIDGSETTTLSLQSKDTISFISTGSYSTYEAGWSIVSSYS